MDLTPGVTGLLGSAVLGTGILFLVEPLLTRRQILDAPNERSSHQQPVLRGGGLGPATAIVLVGCLLPALGAAVGGGTTWVWVAAVAAFASLGWIEDVRGVRTATRALIQLVLGAVTVAALAVVQDPPLWLLPAGAVAIAAFVNVANFMDGLNGLSGLFGLVAGLAYAAVGVVEDLPWLVWSGASVAGAFVAFLPWNAVRPRMFLGDVGSYALGGGVAVLGVAAAFSGVSVIVVLAPVTVYLFDTGHTLVRRVRAGEAWYEAHRSHVYQRLQQAGLSHLSVAAVVASATAACSAAAIAWSVGGWGVRVAVLFAVPAVLSAYLAGPRLVALQSSPIATPPGERTT